MSRERLTWYLVTLATSGPKKQALKQLAKSREAALGVPISGVRCEPEGVRQDVLVARSVLAQINPELLATIEEQSPNSETSGAQIEGDSEG